MHTLKILLLFFGLLAVTKSRPSQLIEENNSAKSDADYESSDDSAGDEYLLEGESTDEISQNRNDVPTDQEIDQNSKVFSGRYSSRKDDYETMSEKAKPENERFLTSENENIKTDVDADEVDGDRSVSNSDNYKESRQIGDTNMQVKSLGSDYVSVPLFKTKQDEVNIDRGEYINEAQVTGEQEKVMKRYQNPYNFETRDIRGRQNDRNFYNNRDRREAPNNEITDVNSTPSEKEDFDLKNENSETSIIENIKKLSNRDLEELLNSLPDDKKAILKKIMEKREITKKAGAVEETYLEGGLSDTNKIEGGYLVDSSTDSETSSSSSSDVTEINKATESGDLDKTKNCDIDNGSGKSESKSQFSNTKDQTLNRVETDISNNDIKSDSNINFNEKSMKTENKREVNKIDYVNSEDVDFKESSDFHKDQDLSCFENEEWLDEKNDEFKTYSDTNKREITPSNPNIVENSVKSLEESFPNDSNGETAMSPLIRVKRTEKDHCNSKRDVNILSNVKVPFFPGVESEGTENDERSEIEDYGFFDRTSNYARSDQNNRAEDKITYKTSGINDRGLKLDQMGSSRKEDINDEAGKTCLGSDTDSVLSGVEGVDENLMYNSGVRNKRTGEVSSLDKNNGGPLSRIGRTAGPINDLANTVADNSINEPHYREEEAFGTLSRNYEGDSGRFKRIRQTKDETLSQEYSTK